MSTMKECIMAAGAYDPNMSNQEMSQIYKVLKESEMDNSSRNDHLSDDEPPPAPKLPKKTTRRPKKLCSLETPLDPLDCKPNEHPPLIVRDRQPIYDIPLYYQPGFRKMPQERRLKLLKEHLIEQAEKLQECYRKSIFPAPWGKPICPSDNFNGNLLKKPPQYEEAKSSLDNTEEDIQEENLPGPSKPKTTSVKTPERQRKRKIFVEEKEDNPNKKTHIATPIPQTKSQTRVSTPDVKTYSSPKTRSEKMFDQLRQVERKLDAEKEREKLFLERIEEDDKEVLNDVNDDDDVRSDETFELKGRNKHLQDDFFGRRRGQPRRAKKTRYTNLDRKYNSLLKENEPSTSKEEPNDGVVDEETEQTCPICGKDYSSDVIEKHASTCGVPFVEKNYPSLRNNDAEGPFTCHFCDEVFTKKTNFREHVTACKHNENEIQ